MSGIEPGRPKIEEREASFIIKGTRLILDAGVEWTVTHVDVGETPDRTTLDLERTAGERIIERFLDVPDSMKFRCRVEDNDR